MPPPDVIYRKANNVKVLSQHKALVASLVCGFRNYAIDMWPNLNCMVIKKTYANGVYIFACHQERSYSDAVIII